MVDEVEKGDRKREELGVNACSTTGVLECSETPGGVGEKAYV